MRFLVSLTLLIAFALAVTLSTNNASAQAPCFDVTCEALNGDMILPSADRCLFPDNADEFVAYTRCCVKLGGLPKLTPKMDVACSISCPELLSQSFLCTGSLIQP